MRKEKNSFTSGNWIATFKTVLFPVLLIAAFGLTWTAVAAGGNYGSRKVALSGGAGILLCVILAARGPGFPGRFWIFRRIIGIFLWLATPPVLFWLTQSNVYDGYALMKARYIASGLWIGFLVLAILTFLTGRAAAAGVLTSLLALVLALANYFVTEFRGTPFSVMDITGVGTALDVAGNYRFTLSVAMGLEVNLFLIWIVLSRYLQTLCIKGSRRGMLGRLGGMAVCAAALAIFVQQVPYQQKFGSGRRFNPAKTYAKLGYWYTMIADTAFLKTEAPEEYAPEKVRERTQELLEEMAAAPAEAAPPENIIVIMNESLADLEAIGPVGTEEPILPFLHSLSENTVKGKCYVHVYGGGTADSEYEVLTGNSKEFLPAEMIAYQAYIHDPEYGLARTLQEYGYRTVAMHPMKASNWNREETYARMGFDDFYCAGYWPWEYEKIRSYVSDQSIYEAIASLCREKAPGEKLFTFCVTMQNHGGFDRDSWTDGFTPSVKLSLKKEYPKAETYLTLARESDRAFEGLLERFADSPQRTMIVLFGDHLPRLETGFYRNLFGGKVSQLADREMLERYQTPYVIWTNYDRPSEELDISANYLGSLILREAGLPGSAYNRLGLQLMETLPVIAPAYVYDASGGLYAAEELPEEYEQLLGEYRSFQYNQIFDRSHLVEEAFSAAALP